jgi:hypothetical protein
MIENEIPKTKREIRNIGNGKGKTKEFDMQEVVDELCLSKG